LINSLHPFYTLKIFIMATPKSTIKVEENDFVNPKKGIQLSVLALAVWTLTSTFYSMSKEVFGKVDYEGFCLFVSFFLSILAGIYIGRLLYKRTDTGTFIIAIVLNILLIYSAVNGIQAGVAKNADVPKEKNSPQDGKDVTQMGFSIPFIDSRPWLKDAYSKTEIQQLRSTTDSLKTELMKMRALSVDSAAIRLQNDNSLLQKKIDMLVAGISGFNDLLSKWNTQLESNPKFEKYIQGYKGIISEFLGNEFYDQFFRQIETKF